MNQQGGRQAQLKVQLQPLEMPLLGDALLIGKQAPIGPEAARRMAELIAPEQYQLIRINHENSPVEALLVRKEHLRLMPKEVLIRLLLEENKAFSAEQLTRVEIELKLHTERTVWL